MRTQSDAIRAASITGRFEWAGGVSITTRSVSASGHKTLRSLVRPAGPLRASSCESVACSTAVASPAGIQPSAGRFVAVAANGESYETAAPSARPASCSYMAARLPHATMVELDSRDHLIWLCDAREQLIAAVRAFVDGLDRAVDSSHAT